MNEKTLNDLIRKGMDERTPELEALACLRIAAKQFSDAKPSAQDTERLGVLEAERDTARAEAAKHKAEAERLRLILGKMMALRDAEQKIDKSRKEVEKEARDAINGKVQVPPAHPVADVPYSPFSNWEADMFGGYTPPWAKRR
jgi:hypothetical protein